MNKPATKWKLLIFGTPVIVVLLLASILLGKSVREVRFDWSESEGFRSITVEGFPHQPTGFVDGTGEKPLLRQSKKPIATELHHTGWTAARGCIYVNVLGPFVMGSNDRVDGPCVVVNLSNTH